MNRAGLKALILLLILYYKERYTQAIQVFQEIVNAYPLSGEAIEASLLIADSLYYGGDYEKAYSRYSDFVNLHPTHPKAPYALFQKGMSAFNRMDTIDRDQESTRKALMAFEEVVSSYPTTIYAERARELIPVCRKRLAENELYIGRFYLKKGHYRGAIGRFSKIVEEYPDSGISDMALFYMGRAYLKMGDRKRAIETLKELVSSFPQSRYSREGERMIEAMEEERDG